MPPVPPGRTTTPSVRQISSAREPRVAFVSVTHKKATGGEACLSASHKGNSIDWLSTEKVVWINLRTRVQFPSVPPSIHTSTPLRFRGKDVCFHIFVRFCCISSSFPLHRLKSYCLSGTLLRLYQSSTLEIQRSVFTPICSVKIGEIGDFGYNSIKTLGFLIQKVGRFRHLQE